AQRDRAPRDYLLLEPDALASLHRDRRGVLEAAGALDPLDAVRLEEAGDALGHLLHDLRLPLVRDGELELRLADADADLRKRLPGLLQPEGRLHLRLGQSATAAQTPAPPLGLLLDP